MKVAALYDIHGNLPALEAVLADVEALGVDAVVIGGDIAIGPMPRASLERLLDLGERALFLRGNGDREIAADHTEAGGGLWVERTRWSAGAARTGCSAPGSPALPGTQSADVDGLGRVALLPRIAEERRGDPDGDLVRGAGRRGLAEVEETVVVCGHTHVQFDRRVAGQRLVERRERRYALRGEARRLLGRCSARTSSFAGPTTTARPRRRSSAKSGFPGRRGVRGRERPRRPERRGGDRAVRAPAALGVLRGSVKSATVSTCGVCGNMSTGRSALRAGSRARATSSFALPARVVGLHET